MRRRKSYTANSDVLGVLFHNMGAAADKRRAEQDRGRRKQQQKIESFQRRQEKSDHYEEMRREKKERLRFEKSDELLIGYRLPSAVTPWVIDYMDSERCDLRHVKREIFEPFSKGEQSVAETIALLAVDKDGDSSNRLRKNPVLCAGW